MKNKKIITIIGAVLILAVGIGVGAYAASTYGTQSDPLVAKSYLDQVLTPQLNAQYQELMDSEIQAMDNKISDVASAVKGNFAQVTLSSGQTLTVNTGCELILRSGSGTAVGTLSDVTSGSALSSGSTLSANHLCVAGANSSGVTASGSVVLLVRGVYTLA